MNFSNIDLSSWISQDWLDVISRNKFWILSVLIIIIFLLRNKISKLFKKKERKIDYSSMMSNGESFDSTFDFNKTLAMEKNKYEERLQQIDKELGTLKLELNKIEEEYTKKKSMLLHRERQLTLQYNTFLNNMNNLEKMFKSHEEMEKEMNDILPK